MFSCKLLLDKGAIDKLSFSTSLQFFIFFPEAMISPLESSLCPLRGHGDRNPSGSGSFVVQQYFLLVAVRRLISVFRFVKCRHSQLFLLSVIMELISDRISKRLNEKDYKILKASQVSQRSVWRLGSRVLACGWIKGSHQNIYQRTPSQMTHESGGFALTYCAGLAFFVRIQQYHILLTERFGQGVIT